MVQFFKSIHKIISVKIHLHHSHVTGKIYGYAHDFSNMKMIYKRSVINKVQFASLIDTRYYFWIELSVHVLDIWHCQIYPYWKKSYPEIHAGIKKDKLLRFENQAVAKHETLSFMEYLFAADNLL